MTLYFYFQPLKSVLSELQQAQTSEDLTVCGKQLVEAVNSRLRRQRQNNTEEMRAVLEERDTAVARVGRLNNVCCGQVRRLNTDVVRVGDFWCGQGRRV